MKRTKNSGVYSGPVRVADVLVEDVQHLVFGLGHCVTLEEGHAHGPLLTPDQLHVTHLHSLHTYTHKLMVSIGTQIHTQL